MAEFDRNVPYPEGSSLFFYPKAGTPAAAARRITRPRRKVVDACLAYRPICF